MDHVTIDFEANCLPRHGRSFPIEVGISSPEGTRSWLIRPHDDWKNWEWSSEAIALHGITPDLLDREGLPAPTVFGDLTRALAGRRVIADSSLDNYWWNRLAAAAGSDTYSPIDHVGTILDELGATTADILFAQSEVDALSSARHRAADDARWLRAFLMKISAMAGERMENPPSPTGHFTPIWSPTPVSPVPSYT